MVPWSPRVNSGHCEPQQRSLQLEAVGLLKPSCVLSTPLIIFLSVLFSEHLSFKLPNLPHLSKLQVWDSSWRGALSSQKGEPASKTSACTNLHLLNPFVLLMSPWHSPAHRIVKASVRETGCWDLMQGRSTDALCLLFLLFGARSQRLLSRRLGQPSHKVHAESACQQFPEIKGSTW